MIPALFGLAGSLTAGGLNYAGQASANKATRKMVRDQMSFQEGSVKIRWPFRSVCRIQLTSVLNKICLRPG